LLDDQTVWLTIAGMGIVTFLLRLSFIALLEHVSLPILVRRGLDFVPPAVFSALILPDIAMHSFTQATSINMHSRLIAGTVALLVAWRTKNVMLTIAAGLVILWILQVPQP
jgi:branched-subunit amino acid transport protein